MEFDMKRARQTLRHTGRFFAHVLLRLFTLFYYKPLQYYTCSPIECIIKDHNNPVRLGTVVKQFRLGKQYEQKLVGIAGTLSAGATIGVFSWPDIAQTHWYARALFYTSLLLAIFSLIGSSQQRLSETIQCVEDANTPSEDRENALRVFLNPDEPPPSSSDGTLWSWYTLNMAFIWQWTFMVWSWVAFIVGLLLHVIRPFLPEQEPIHAERNVAFWFVGLLGLVVPSYVWCTWWTGHVTSKLDASSLSCYK